MKMEQIGRWSFILGVLIAILAAFAGTAYTQEVAMLLVVLGVIVGFLNITEKEVYNFLIAAIALLLTGTATFVALNQVYTGLGTMINQVVANIATFVAPAAVIVAIKAVLVLGKKR